MRTLLAFVLLGAAGCSGGLRATGPANQVYVLHATVAQEPEAIATGATLRLLRPLPFPGLDSDRIVLLQPGNRLDFYAASRWAAPLPELVEALAAQTLRSSGAWDSVHDSRSAFPAEYVLQITIHRFEADYSAQADSPVVRVSLECVLGRRSDRTIIATFQVDASERAGENRLRSVVAAFERAANAALADASGRAAESVRTSTVHLPP